MRRKWRPEMSYMELAEQFIQEIQGTLEPGSLAKYKEIIHGALRDAFGDKTLSEINAGLIRDFVIQRRNTLPRMKMEVCVLNLMLTCALNHHAISQNPCELVALPRKWQKEIAVLKDQDICAIEEGFSDHRYFPLIMFMIYTGLRIGEALAITWDRVDWDGKKLRVDQTMDDHYDPELRCRVRALKNRTKNGMDTVLVLCDQAVQILQSAKEKSLSSEWVFIEPNGDEIRYADFYYEFNKIMAAIGRPEVTPHGLRHTAATTILSTTKDMIAVRDYLRHRGLRTSLRYPCASEHELRALADFFNDRFMPCFRTERRAGA